MESVGDVEVSPDGSVYVADNRGLRVVRYNLDGKQLGSIRGGLSAPIGISVDLDCNWMANIAQRRIEKRTPLGKVLATAASPDLIAVGIAVGRNGDIYASENGNRSIVHFAEDRSKPATGHSGQAHRVDGPRRQGAVHAQRCRSTIPNWTRTGSFTVVKYGAPGGFPDAAVSQTIGGKTNFFAGGPSNPKSGATQVVNVTRYKAAIDAGKRTATLSGFLGGYSSQADALAVSATFLSATGKTLGVLRIGPVSATQRNNVTTLLQKSASKLVPKSTRWIQVKLTAARTSGSYNDGYADNLALTLAGS